MQIGIFAKTFPGSDPDTVLAAVNAAGFVALNTIGRALVWPLFQTKSQLVWNKMS